MKHPTKRSPDDEADALMSVFDIGRTLHVSPPVALYLCTASILPARKRRVGGVLRIWTVRKSELDEFLGKAAEAAGSIQEFYARIAAAREAREKAHELLETHIEWNGQGD